MSEFSHTGLPFVRVDPETLRSLLQYDPDSGVFVWKHRIIPAHFNSRFAGKVAGYANGGYWQIRINGVHFQAHRLAWVYAFGEDPPPLLDHIDGNKINNRIQNLRPATVSENAHNTFIRVNNTSGFPGVFWDKSCRKWRAEIGLHRQKIRLGFFANIEDAAAARAKAVFIYHGAFGRAA